MKKYLLALPLLGLLLSAALLPAWAQRGQYKGGHSSPYKGGSYKNKSTNDHYRHRM